MKITDATLGEPDDTAPDFVGERPECPTCGTWIGPLTPEPVEWSYTISATCGCGNRLEAIPQKGNS